MMSFDKLTMLSKVEAVSNVEPLRRFHRLKKTASITTEHTEYTEKYLLQLCYFRVFSVFRGK